MARVRSAEEIRREMEFVNNSAERARAREIHAARDDDEAKRRTTPSVSSSQALVMRQRALEIKTDKAIAEVIDQDLARAEDNSDWESSPAIMPIKPPVITLSVPTWWVNFYDIPGMDQLPVVLHYIVLQYLPYHYPAHANPLPEEKMRYQYSGTTFFTRYITNTVSPYARSK